MYRSALLGRAGGTRARRSASCHGGLSGQDFGVPLPPEGHLLAGVVVERAATVVESSGLQPLARPRAVLYDPVLELGYGRVAVARQELRLGILPVPSAFKAG